MSTVRYWSELDVDGGKSGNFEESPKRLKIEDDSTTEFVEPQSVFQFEDQVVGLSKAEIVSGLAAVLELQCSKNMMAMPHEDVKEPSEPLSLFYSSFKQKFGMEFYVRRLMQYMDCSNNVFIVAFCYLDRIQKEHRNANITSFNVHRMLMTAALLAAKYLDDDTYTNRYYAKVGGVPTLAEMNLLESRMLQLLGWRLDVSPSQLRYYNEYIRLGAHM